MLELGHGMHLALLRKGKMIRSTPNFYLQLPYTYGTFPNLLLRTKRWLCVRRADCSRQLQTQPWSKLLPTWVWAIFAEPGLSAQKLFLQQVILMQTDALNAEASAPQLDCCVGTTQRSLWLCGVFFVLLGTQKMGWFHTRITPLW